MSARNAKRSRVFLLSIVCCMAVSVNGVFASEDSIVTIVEHSDYLVDIQIYTQSVDEEGKVVGEVDFKTVSGFIVGDTVKEVLTASHFFDGSPTKIEASCIFRPRLSLAPQDLTLIGWDKMLDVALFRFNDQTAVKNIVSAQLGNSRSLKVGQKVLTLGCSSPLDWAATSGRVVAMSERLMPGLAIQPELIIHDCILNSGGSGGPLLDIRGKVVGVNVLLLFPHGEIRANIFSGAVLIDDVQTILPDLRRGGVVPHPPIEIMFGYTSKYDFRNFGYTDGLNDQGIMVENIMVDSLADRAGLQFGDIVRSINGKPAPKKVADCYRLLYMPAKPYNLLEFEIERAGERLTLPIALMKVRELFPSKEDEKEKESEENNLPKEDPEEEE